MGRRGVIKFDMNANLTMEIDLQEYEMIKEDCTDEDGNLDEDELQFQLERFLDGEEFSLVEGRAWICSAEYVGML